jgi:hypothetical protein
MQSIEFILASKNDEYCGKSIDRLKTSLKHNLKILNKYDNWQITVVDWGSDVKISEALGFSHENLNFIYIDKDITSTIPYKFSEVHALNCAIRLSNSKFIGRLDQDILIGNKFIKWFFNNNIDDKCFYHCKRTDLYPGVNKINSLEKEINCDIDVPAYEAADGIILVSTEILKHITGYNETQIFFNHMQKDLFFRLNKIIKFIDLTPIIGYDFYHLWHERYDPDRIYNEEKHIDYYRSIDLIINDPNIWGLKNLKIEKYT